MFEVTTTGENPYYGKKGEKRLLCDNNLIIALKRGWITENFKYKGHVKTAGAGKLPFIEQMMPVKRIDIIKTLELQNLALKRLQDKLDALIKVNEGLTRLVITDGCKRK